MIWRAIKLAVKYWKLRADPVSYFRSRGVQIGEGCRLLGLHPETFGSEPYLVKLGNHVEITSGVKFITHDGGVWVFREKNSDIDVIAPIIIGNNVFIGTNAIIMPGVTIGDNCVIGAGAVVTRDIPSGHVAVGSPARCIKTIDEYWAKIQTQAFHIRSFPVNEKQNFLKQRFEI
jgi:acetyltransferase-like isoleucine patch superfamily enzyme